MRESVLSLLERGETGTGKIEMFVKIHFKEVLLWLLSFLK
jgi:hypothetical protein